MTITKADMAEWLAHEIGCSKREAKEIVTAFFDELKVALLRGEDVKLTAFGSFEIKTRKARVGRNPKTGVVVTIPERRTIRFRPSQMLRVMARAYGRRYSGNS